MKEPDQSYSEARIASIRWGCLQRFCQKRGLKAAFSFYQAWIVRRGELGFQFA